MLETSLNELKASKEQSLAEKDKQIEVLASEKQKLS